mmetsp:Transcript_18508/g.71469  ORF Transcript_18508/g.71469 Transcript_18508/m.71469 type:complete len:170 (-) Transcript_18508:77-586(-)
MDESYSRLRQKCDRAVREFKKGREAHGKPVGNSGSDRLIFDTTCQFSASLVRSALSAAMDRQEKATDGRAEGRAIHEALLEEGSQAVTDCAAKDPVDDELSGKKRTVETDAPTEGRNAKRMRRSSSDDATESQTSSAASSHITVTADDVRTALAFHSAAWLLEDTAENS